jgi:intracellular multiplication protein IcmL
MSSPRVEAAPKNNLFYRDHYLKLMIGFISLVGFLVLVSSVVMYQVFHKPMPRFTAISADGQRRSLNAYLEPNLLSTTITTWASKAAVAAYTFDFVNYAKQLEFARPYFTEAGWGAYQAALAPLLQRVSQNQLFVNGVVVGDPVISNQGDLPGYGYSWRVQIPFLVTYQSAGSSKSQNFLIDMLIVKVPTTINPDSIGIDKFTMS